MDELLSCPYGRLTRSGRAVLCRADLCKAGVFTVWAPLYGVPFRWCAELCPLREKENKSPVRQYRAEQKAVSS